MLESFFICILLGMLVSAPIGAVGLLCIRQSLAYGQCMGVLSGMSTGLAEGLYAAIAVFGFSSLSGYLFAHIREIQGIGLVLLLINGVQLLRQKTIANMPTDKPQKNPHRLRQMLHIFIFTIFNPGTFVGVPATLAATGMLDHTSSISEAWVKVAGWILGTWIWWLIVSSTIAHYRHKVNPKTFIRFNHITGGFLCFFALGIALHLAFPESL